MTKKEHNESRFEQATPEWQVRFAPLLSNFLSRHSDGLYSLLYKRMRRTPDNESFQKIHRLEFTVIMLEDQNTNPVITEQQLFSLWWHCQDLLLFLNAHEERNNTNIKMLIADLEALQESLVPKKLFRSKENKQLTLKIAWFRTQRDLRDSMKVARISGGIDTLNRWLTNITTAINEPIPSKSERTLACYALSGLIEQIEALDNPVEDQSSQLPLLKQMRSFLRVR